MAVTVNQYPSTYTPAFNPQMFEATSTNIGSAGFQYRIVATDLGNSATQTYNVPKAPTTYECKWNSSVFSKLYLDSYVPNNEYGWKRVTNGLRKIRVDIGEYTTGGGYVAGSTFSPPSVKDFYVWNSAVRTLDFVSYNQTDYVYDTGTSNYPYLNEIDEEVTYSDRSSFLYVLQSSTSEVNSVQIITYDSNGSVLGSSRITNPLIGSGSFEDRYICIDVGLKGLTNINAGLVTGTYPIITASVASYDVFDYQGPANKRLMKSFTVGCEPKHEVYTLHYLAKNGQFETLHMNKVSEFSITAEKTTYRTNPNTLSSNQWNYTKFAEWEKVLSSTETEQYLLNSDWLSDDKLAIHRQIFTSPRIYIDYGSSIGLVPVLNRTPTYMINQAWNKKQEGITLTVEPTYRNNYQHG